MPDDTQQPRQPDFIIPMQDIPVRTGPVLTRLRYDRVPLTRAEALNLRAFQCAHLDELRKGVRAQLDALTAAKARLRQRKLDTHRTVTVELEPGDPGYDEASPVTADDGLRGTFAWVGGGIGDEVIPTGTMR